MKRIMVLSLLLLCFSSSVQALSWAYAFVVWKGNVYEVKEEVMLDSDEIGKRIGMVKTKADDMTGLYYGNASNYYQIGTEYYEINGIDPSKAIAIKDENKWLKAVYVHKASFHIMNVFSHPFYIVGVALIILSFIGFQLKRRKFT